MKRTYYMDNSTRVFERRFLIVTEKTYQKMINDPDEVFWSHHFISGEFDSLEQARAYFEKEWKIN